ncbi:hypothetical protein NHX12_028399 [Muraenolepis orangiensis]|uniref:Uncharacterized protein n=1 Tax=Muraenolepis orangiensis TaxID=630683 RepID=A0A9Q0IM36_9TELE|nr:hypothetical protein NHX12_028399 [Muraenolepis orangiensis]
MEDVVLHYKPSDAGQLSSLVWRTETALEPFPCRVLPIFTPWFPSTGDRSLPIRPSKPAPPAYAVTQRAHLTLQYDSKCLPGIEGAGSFTSKSVPFGFKSDAKADTAACTEYDCKQDTQTLIRVVNTLHKTNGLQNPTQAAVITDALSRSNATQGTRTGKSQDVSYILRSPRTPLVPVGQTSPPDHTSPHTTSPTDHTSADTAIPPDPTSADTARLSPEKRTQRDVGGAHIRDGVGARRSWSVVAHAGGLPVQSTPSLSTLFHNMVAEHGLHLRQRARWLIAHGTSEDMEQVSLYYRQ